MAASLAGAEIMYLRGVLRDLEYDVSEPTVLWVDNSGAVELSTKQRRESAVRSRHIERRHLKIREWVAAEGHIVARFKPTADNRAGMFTKPLPPDDFFRATGSNSWAHDTLHVAALPRLKARQRGG
ncbi:hypothetical protein AB1Y20_022116 [Prymnesium parvum]|uniref:Uncharacterized protein n=1 Tax=Prymnesium parvum TaxID=97485 RepID=A0AB34JI19_PRYPA